MINRYAISIDRTRGGGNPIAMHEEKLFSGKYNWKKNLLLSNIELMKNSLTLAC